MKLNRTSRKSLVIDLTCDRLSPRFHLCQKGGDDIRQCLTPPANGPRFMKQTCPQHAFQRAHISSFIASDQSGRGGFTDQHVAPFGRKEHSGWQRIGASLDAEATHLTILQHRSG